MLPFSKSTSGLVLPKRNDGPLPSISEVPPKRPSSTEGRFVILDKKTKPWSYSSSDSSSDEGEPVAGHSGMKFTWPKTPAASAVTVPPAPAPKKMATGGSRFRIVPVESRYHRDRWDCYDYYDKPSYPTSSKMSCPPPLTDIPINGNRSRSGPRTAPPMRTASFGFDIPPPVVSVPSTAPQSKTEQQNPQHTQDNNNIQRKQATANPLSHTQRDLNNKYTPSEALQNGLETTLSKEVAVAEPKKVVYRERPIPSNYTTSSSATTPQMVAIDSKIEQAMDLVKTHLMFAVREEVEVLRARIVDLEHHVVHLETENSVLRDHIPQDVLQKLSSH